LFALPRRRLLDPLKMVTLSFSTSQQFSSADFFA
jgi:hypothetical protein